MKSFLTFSIFFLLTLSGGYCRTNKYQLMQYLANDVEPVNSKRYHLIRFQNYISSSTFNSDHNRISFNNWLYSDYRTQNPAGVTTTNPLWATTFTNSLTTGTQQPTSRVENTNIQPFYKTFLPDINGKSIRNRKHYVAYNFKKYCIGDDEPYYVVKIQYFDCEEEAREFYNQLYQSDNNISLVRYNPITERFPEMRYIVEATNYSDPNRNFIEVMTGDGYLLYCE